MAVPTVDGRKLWLEEGLEHGGNFLAKMISEEAKRPLSTAELKFKHLAAAYIYLYEKAKDAGVLNESDDEFIFNNETIH